MPPSNEGKVMIPAGVSSQWLCVKVKAVPIFKNAATSAKKRAGNRSKDKEVSGKMFFCRSGLFQ